MRQRDDLVFPLVEFERRLRELRQRMVEVGVEVMITTTPENICYLSGFESPGHYYFFALIIPLEGEPVSISRVLEDSGVEELTWIEVRRPYAVFDDPIDKVHTTLSEFNWQDKRIGYEKGCWFFTALQQDHLMSKCPNAGFIDCTGIIEKGRLIKSIYEIQLIREAARAAEAGMQAGVDAIQVGVKENEVAADIHHAMIRAGSEWPAISPFIASGYRGAIGHATWTRRTIKQNEFVFLEIGGCVRRYHAAMMRSVYVGQPSKAILTVVDAVQNAMQAILDAIKPGISAGEVDAIGREITSASSYQQAWLAGYSIGIGFPPDWGEGHILSIKHGESRLLEENMTFHLIPWVQIRGEGGIAFSATIQVTANGCELLTQFPSELFVK